MADLQWEQFTLGQNKVIQDIASAASKASALVELNATIAKATLETGKVLLMGLLNPQLLLLVAIADEIDNFVNDFKGTGFYILEIVPTGNEILPKDVDGNPIKILLAPVALTASYTASAAAGFGDQWIDWFKVISGGETDPNNPQRSTYFVDQKKSKAEADRTENANDDSVTDVDTVFGFPKMTPSTVISQIVAAMDEEADINRPNFSSSAEVAGIVVIIGFADLTKNIKSLQTIFDAFLTFFGGETGIFTKGILSMKDIIDKDFFGKISSIQFQRVGLIPPQIKDTNVVIDLAIHDIDLSNYLIGSTPDNVTAHLNNTHLRNRFDSCDILMRYNQTTSYLQSNWITPVKIRNLIITGEKGYARLNLISKTIELYENIIEIEYDDYGDYIANTRGYFLSFKQRN